MIGKEEENCKKDSQQSSAQKLTFEGCQNNTAIAMLCLAFCIQDIMNKVGMCGSSVRYVTIQPFQFLIG